MKDTSPALSEMPMTLPSSFFQVSSTPNPRTSRYQPRLFSRSLTVKLGDAERRASGPPSVRRFEDATCFGFRGVVFLARAVFVDFLAAIVFPPGERGYGVGLRQSNEIPLGVPPGPGGRAEDRLSLRLNSRL